MAIRMRSLVRLYAITAVALLTLALGAVIVNLVPWAVYKARPLLHEAGAETDPFLARYGEAVYGAFPDLDRAEVRGLLREIWRRRREYEPISQFREAPFRGRHVNVDEAGFRHGREQAPWPPPDDKLSVFVFGNSNTFGYGVADGETVSSHLQALLSRRLARPVAVYNFGRGSYNSNHETLAFIRLLFEGHVPDVAIFIEGTNEFLTSGTPRLNWSDALASALNPPEGSGFMGNLKALWRETPLLKTITWLDAMIGESRRSAASTDAPEPMEKSLPLARAVIARYQWNRRLIETLAQGFAVTTVFVWEPIAAYAYGGPALTFEDFGHVGSRAQLSGYGLIEAAIRQDAFGNNFIWCAGIQRGRSKPLYVDGIHYSHRMNALLAGCVVDEIVSRKLVLAE